MSVFVVYHFVLVHCDLPPIPIECLVKVGRSLGKKKRKAEKRNIDKLIHK